MYFQYSRGKAKEYINFLLKEKFTAQNVTHPNTEDDPLTINDIDEYVTSLQQSIKPWFYIHNPQDQSLDLDGGDITNRKFLDRLNRLNFGAFRPLILAAYVKQNCVEDINKLLEAVEKYNFLLFKVSQRRSNTGDSEFYRRAHDLFTSECADMILEIVSKINDWNNDYFKPEYFLQYISEKFERKDGFYTWNGLHYFLYEYEEHLRSKSKSNTEKLTWDKLTKKKEDYVTVEHIYPQTGTDKYWQNRYKEFTDQQKKFLTHSLGNLLPLSRAKNSSLQNHSFELKKDNGERIGYYNGSFSENEINKMVNWDAQNILDRGIELLEFMESRWDVKVKDKQFKAKLLHLDFLLSEDEKGMNRTTEGGETVSYPTV